VFVAAIGPAVQRARRHRALGWPGRAGWSAARCSACANRSTSWLPGSSG
jgi:hypothetical protein